MRKIILASPREPSGATWLINCFIELGIMTYRVSPPSMWKKNGENYVLTGREQLLKKWLPALTDHDTFNFRDDVEVQWLHEWPSSKFSNCEVIFFVRDPRDAFYSRYKRENPNQSLREFINFPDVQTLLDKVDNWSVFNKCWLSHPNVHVVRFEDYKTSAKQTLTSLLDTLDLEFSNDDIQRSVDCSTYARAAKCEEKYHKRHPEDREIINRGGRVGEWKALGHDPWLINLIEERCGDLLGHYGYKCSNHNGMKTEPSGLPNIHTLSFFQDVCFPDEIYYAIASEDSDRNITHIASIIDQLIHGRIKVSDLINNIREYETYWLIESLEEFSVKNGNTISSQLQTPASVILRKLKDLKKTKPGNSIFVRAFNRLKRCIKNPNH